MLIGDVFNPDALQLRGDPFYDAAADLVDLFGKVPAGIGLIVFGLALGALFYWKAEN